MANSRSPPRQEAFAAELAEEIAAGKYPKGARFPTEQELQQRFQVGRHTAREALKILTEQGLLGRRRKTGTIVLALRPVEHYVHSLRSIRGLFDFAQSTQLDIHYQGFVSASVKDQEEFALPDKRWLRISGVRSKNGDKLPLCWAEITISERFAPDRENIRQGTRALYELVMAQHGLNSNMSSRRSRPPTSRRRSQQYCRRKPIHRGYWSSAATWRTPGSLSRSHIICIRPTATRSRA